MVSIELDRIGPIGPIGPMVPTAGAFAAGRWKQVEVLENGNVVATGWIDADATRKVEKIK